MIASLAGTLVEKAPDRLLIEVGGVGYAVHVSLQTFTGLSPTGTAVRLLVHTEVREDAIELVGFANASERALFHLLRKVKGLGPKTCLTVLSGVRLLSENSVRVRRLERQRRRRSRCASRRRGVGSPRGVLSAWRRFARG